MTTKPSVLPTAWDVPAAIRNRLGDQAGRQRLMTADDHLLLVLHRPPDPDDRHRTGRFMWRKPDGSWQSSDLGPGVKALATHVQQFAELIDRYDRQLDDAASSDDLYAIVRALSPLKRTAANLLDVLEDARRACPEERDLINIRDAAYSMSRQAELLYHDARHGLEFAVARQSERQAAHAQRQATAAHRLNLLVAFFFPLATLSAVFGVSLPHGLEDRAPPTLFIGLIAVGLLTGLLLNRFVARSAVDAPREVRRRKRRQ